MLRATAACCSVISVLFAGCSTIVKGTEQQVSVNTPGVPGAMCQLLSPAIGTRTVPDLSKYCSAEEPAQRRRLLLAQCYSPGVGTLCSHRSHDHRQ